MRLANSSRLGFIQSGGGGAVVGEWPLVNAKANGSRKKRWLLLLDVCRSRKTTRWLLVVPFIFVLRKLSLRSRINVVVYFKHAKAKVGLLFRLTLGTDRHCSSFSKLGRVSNSGRHNWHFVQIAHNGLTDSGAVVWRALVIRNVYSVAALNVRSNGSAPLARQVVKSRRTANCKKLTF